MLDVLGALVADGNSWWNLSVISECCVTSHCKLIIHNFLLWMNLSYAHTATSNFSASLAKLLLYIRLKYNILVIFDWNYLVIYQLLEIRKLKFVPSALVVSYWKLYLSALRMIIYQYKVLHTTRGLMISNNRKVKQKQGTFMSFIQPVYQQQGRQW